MEGEKSSHFHSLYNESKFYLWKAHVLYGQWRVEIVQRRSLHCCEKWCWYYVWRIARHTSAPTTNVTGLWVVWQAGRLDSRSVLGQSRSLGTSIAPTTNKYVSGHDGDVTACRSHRAAVGRRAEISSTDNVTEARSVEPAQRSSSSSRAAGLCSSDVDKLLTMLRTRERPTYVVAPRDERPRALSVHVECRDTPCPAAPERSMRIPTSLLEVSMSDADSALHSISGFCSLSNSLMTSINHWRIQTVAKERWSAGLL